MSRRRSFRGRGRLGMACSHSDDWGVSLFVQTAERLALRKRGKRIGMRLAEVYAAGLFLYGRKGIGIKMDDLFNVALAGKILRSCESVATACFPSIMPIGRRCGLGLEAVVRGSARNEYWLYFLRTMTGRVNSRLLPLVS